MAIFSLISTAGFGIEMSTLTGGGFGFAMDEAGLVHQKWDDRLTATSGDGSLSISRWNVHHGAADTMTVTYHPGTDGECTVIQNVEFGGYPLIVSDLELDVTATEYERGAWVHRLNEGDDTFYGTNYTDVIQAGSGHDVVYGYAGDDSLYGNDGRDELFGGEGDDLLFGGAGADILSGGAGRNYLDGGAGFDIAVLGGGRDDYAFTFQSDGSVVVRNGAGEALDTLIDIEAVRFADGSANLSELVPSVQQPPQGGNTPLPPASETPAPAPAPAPAPGPAAPEQPAVTDAWIYGLWWPDRLRGSDLNDHIFGKNGDDWLYGAGGNDWLHGGRGSDNLHGGGGKDAFVFDTKQSKHSFDRIVDFNVRDDSIYLENAVFKKIGKAGQLKKSAFWTGEKAHDANDRIIFDKKSGALYYDADGTGAAEQVKFAQVNKNLKMTFKDFFVI